MTSDAATVEEYLAGLPEERRAALEAVRQVILANLPEGYEETMQYGMIGYVVPHRIYPPGYHCDPKQPLPFAGLGSQNQHMSLYLMCVYGHGALRAEFEAACAAGAPRRSPRRRPSTPAEASTRGSSPRARPRRASRGGCPRART